MTIYTDGGCDPNPGPGGWGAVLVSGMKTKEISGAEPHTTNNRMELTAAVSALGLLRQRCRVDLYTDSQYLRNGITRWIDAWVANDWRRRGGAPVENVDLWQALLAEVGRHEVEWHWVRGHRGNPLNERADALATEARRRMLAEGRARPRPGRPSARTGEGAGPDLADLPVVTIHARGCALGVPGPGGYAAVVEEAGGQRRIVSGGWPSATSNVMELWAAIAGLRALESPSRVTVHSPSKYVVDGASRWLARWERNRWRTRSGDDVKNRELWQELAKVMGDHDITWRYLPAGADSEPSALAAQRAREEAERIRG